MNILDMTIDELIPVYLDTIVPSGTRRATKCALKNLSSFLETTPIRHITPDHLEKWKIWLADDYLTKRRTPLSAKTQETYMALAKVFFKWVWSNHSINAIESPVKNFTATPLYKDIPNENEIAMRVDDFYLMYEKAKEIGDWLSLVSLSFLEATGVRVEAFVALQMKDLNLEKRTALVYNKGARIRTRNGPVRKRYKVAFHERCANDLEEFIRMDRGLRPEGYLLKTIDGRTSTGTSILRGKFRKIAKLCDIDDRPHNPHSLRHMFAIQRLLAGISPELVSQLMGHSSVHVTMKHYGKFINKNDLTALYDMTIPDYLKKTE